MNLAASKKIVRVLERERFRKTDTRIFPRLSNRRKTNLRREPRRDDNDPLIAEPSRETDTRVCKRPARAKRQIFSAIEKIDMFPAKLQQSLG